MKKLWVRLGVSLNLTEEEVGSLLGDDCVVMKDREKIIRNIISENRFEIDGECYAPEASVKDFNCEYDTEFYECDYDLFW
jgi:hypothetical protein